MAQPTELALGLSGQLRVRGPLGQGSTAEVHAIEDARGEAFALKVGRDPEEARRLASEARALLFAASPALPQALGAGWVVRTGPDGFEGVTASAPDARPAIALSLRAGRPLSEAWGDPAVLAAGIARALSDLHAAGVAHGDVKPGNVRVLADGGIELLDLGLSRRTSDVSAAGGTPRYVALGDGDLGSSSARDLIALGLMLAEAIDPALRGERNLLGAARAANWVGPVGEIVRALIAVAPSARPSAKWVEERATRIADDAASTEQAVARRAAHIRGTYLRVRGASAFEGPASMFADASISDALPTWLGELAASLGALDALDPPTAPARPLEPLGPMGIARWIVALVGPSAAGWPLAKIGRATERALSEAMLELANTQSPEAWTIAALEAALDQQAIPTGRRTSKTAVDPRPVEPRSTMSAGDAAELALGLVRVPASAVALRAIEDDDRAPTPLVLEAARALRLRGDHGRALVLLDRVVGNESSVSFRSTARALAADIHRRAGSHEVARSLASSVLAELGGTGMENDREARASARACLARLELDLGRPAAATELAQPLDDAGVSEVAALALAAQGNVAGAVLATERGLSLASSAEHRARLAGARGYALSASDPRAAHLAFASAAEHAVQAGAMIEEATYLTGVASTGVDVGFLSAAASAATRAALLWEHAGHPERAARAMLSRAAAFAVVQRADEARAAAELALTYARESGDTRAEGYVACVLSDVAIPGSAEGAAAAARARATLTDHGDVLRAAARQLGHGTLGANELGRFDAMAEDPRTIAGARLEWWGARSSDLTRRPGMVRPEPIVHALVALVAKGAAISARGPAMVHGAAIAASAGLGEAALQLRAAASDAASQLIENAGDGFREPALDLAWTRAATSTAPGALSGISSAQVRELERLVRDLGSSARLGDLLRNVLDALVAWTGVERGLLLLRAPDGRLVPRAARNLARSDLAGEQLVLSQSLAKKALEALEPVVAVDATGELPDLSESVHALRLRSVLAVPLIARGEVLGVAYLDDRVRSGAFGERELAWVRMLAQLAASLVAAELASAKLRRVARKAERARRAAQELATEQAAKLEIAVGELELREGRDQGGPFARIVGRSEPIRRTIRLAARVAKSAMPVLISGESGSGKELFARAIHLGSERATRAFVSENCGAIPEALLESALFGHVRGAFTGADRNRIGLFAAADGGTLFLDEVGEMSLGMQAKLLRVIEDGIVRPLGTERAREVNVRLIAATNRDLSKMVAERRFREDLYYRIAIVTLEVPPLRERRDDIPLLVAKFLELHADGMKTSITASAMRALGEHPWPGNVRQLESEIRRALVLSDGTIDREHLGREVVANGPPRGVSPDDLDLRARVDALEVGLIEEAMTRTHRNQTQAAKLLGVSRFGLQKMMKRLGI